MTNKKHQVAIINCKDVHFNYGDDHEVLIQSISDWSEVTTEELSLLNRFSLNYSWKVIERLDSDPKFIATTVQAALNQVKAQQKAQEEAKAKAEAAKVQRELKRKAKTQAEELRLLQTLQSKYKDKQ